MTILYRFDDDEYEFEADIDDSDIAEYLFQDVKEPTFKSDKERIAWRDGAITALTTALYYYDFFKDEVENSDEFYDYVKDTYEDEAYEAYQDDLANMD